MINLLYYKRAYIWNPSICAFEINKYLRSIISDSVTTCDKIVETSEIKLINKIKWDIMHAHFFRSYHTAINNRYYMLLFHKNRSK